MATTSKPVTELKMGFRDTSGAAVASGTARFYQPGTLIQQTVYQDATCSTAFLQPVTLSAQGAATVYTLEAVRCVVKSSDGATTYYDDIVNLVRADSVYMTVPGVNSGNETTVENAFALVATGLGADFLYRWKGSTTATARPYTTTIGERWVNVKDFGADGTEFSSSPVDDTTAIQNAINSGAGVIYFPIGSYKITSKLRFTSTNGTQKFVGEGRGRTTIVNYSTTDDVFDLTTFGTEDYRLGISDLTISANTSSSGRGIYIPAAGTKGVTIERVTITGHATGIYAGGTDVDIRDCNVTYTGVGAANYGIYSLGNGRISNCVVIGPGIGGSDTGIVLGGSSTGDTCRTTSCKTGFSVGSGGSIQRTVALNCYAITCAVGFAIPASADQVTVLSCAATTCTTDISFGASCINVNVIGSAFATSSGTALSYRNAAVVSALGTTSNATPATFTPDVTSGQVRQLHVSSYAAGAQALTIAAPTGLATMLDGTLVYIQIIKTGANAANLTWNGAYLDGDSSSFSGVAAVASNTEVTVVFMKLAATLVRVMVGVATAV